MIWRMCSGVKVVMYPQRTVVCGEVKNEYSDVNWETVRTV